MNAKDKYIAAKMAEKKKKKKQPMSYTENQLSGGRALEGLMTPTNPYSRPMMGKPMGGMS